MRTETHACPDYAMARFSPGVFRVGVMSIGNLLAAAVADIKARGRVAGDRVAEVERQSSMKV